MHWEWFARLPPASAGAGPASDSRAWEYRLSLSAYSGAVLTPVLNPQPLPPGFTASPMIQGKHIDTSIVGAHIG